MSLLSNVLGGGVSSNSIKNPFGVSGVGNIGSSFGQSGPSISANFNRLLKKKMDPTKVRGELSSLYSSPVEESIVFPKDLDDQHYIMLEVKNRVRASADKADKKRTWQTIVLPIPANLKVDYKLNYENASLGILGGAAAGGGSPKDAMSDIAALAGSKMNTIASAMGIGSNTDGDKRGASALADSVGTIGTAAGLAFLGKKASGSMLGGALTAGAVGADNVGTALMMKQGIAINPHLAQIFKGVGLRDFSYQWKFVPRDHDESRIIMKLITTLKRYSHPAYFAGQYAFDYPMEFDIRFSDAVANNLYAVNRSVLTGISVDYGAEGTPLFFDDGSPMSVSLSLNFQETIIKTAEDFGSPRRSAGSEVDGEFEQAKAGSLEPTVGNSG
jgi:hypothetical protein